MRDWSETSLLPKNYMREAILRSDKASRNVRQQLAPDGVLRIAINLSNSLLVSGKSADGEWDGIAPDLARSIASALDLSLELVAFATPSEVIDAVDTGAWAVALVGAEPERARHIAFSEPYAEIEAGYLVPPGSKLGHVDEVDSAGHRIAAFQGSAYDLWLRSNLRHATLVHAKSFAETFQRFKSEGIEALASLKPKLLADQREWPGTRILPESFMSVQQSIGTSAGNREAAMFLQQFVQRAKKMELIESLIDKHEVTGLKVARQQSPA